MSIMWICSSVNYQIINIYLKYIPGSEYLNISIAGVSEILAHLTVGLLFGKLGPRLTFLLGYTIAGAGGACLMFQNQFAGNTYLVAGFVLLAKFGASMTYCTCQISTPWMFPVLLAGTCFGICNLFGRFAQASAPFIVEMKIPIPMTAFTGMAAIAWLTSLLIKKVKDA